MNYEEEARYIESIDVTNIPQNYNRDLKVFATYCQMQHNGARREKQWTAASAIGAVVCNVQEHIVRMAMIDYLAWNDSNSEWERLRDNYAEASTYSVADGVAATLLDR